ncbi:hypothetical protein NDU88_007424 [Pleurodeles waltl]|uniref:Uncharacterized protein n=1 Tax=Pleurodeles waltl TaxID=8319 RepID=A0AAV7VUF4_PLEWA|nr:hypothetical protein NDU88_007424 [Pleurodeles waltl]
MQPKKAETALSRMGETPPLCQHRAAAPRQPAVRAACRRAPQAPGNSVPTIGACRVHFASQPPERGDKAYAARGSCPLRLRRLPTAEQARARKAHALLVCQLGPGTRAVADAPHQRTCRKMHRSAASTGPPTPPRRCRQRKRQ